MAKSLAMKRHNNNGLAAAVCVCGQCFNLFAKPYVGIRLSDDGYTKVMLTYLDGSCPKAKLKRPRPKLSVVKNPLTP